MTSRHVRVTLIVIAVLIAIGAGMWWLTRPEPVSVIVRKVDKGMVQDTVANTRAGTVKACRRAGLSPTIGGQIVRLPVREGDRVKAGQILMEFWNVDRRAQRELARNEHVAARARANQACVLADVARREAERLRVMKKKGLAAEEAVDKADGEARAQAAACRAARAQEKVSESRIQVAEAALEQTRLTAPFDGIVAEVNGEIGEFVTPSPVGVATPPAIDLIDMRCVYISAPIDEVDAPKIRTGMPARISLDAFRGKVFTGHVRRIAPYVLTRAKQARTVDVEAEFENPGESRDMLPGYSADIEVIVAEKADVLRVPTEAILEGDKVLVFRDGEPLEQRRIETGLGNWEWTEVVSGLKAGEEVVVSVDRKGVEAGVAAVRETQED